MKNILICSLIAFYSFAHADEYAEIKKLKNTTLCVVIDDENIAAYTKLKSAVEKLWDFNKLQFIKKGEVEKYINDPQFSVMTFIAMSQDPAVAQNPPRFSVASIGLASEVKRFSGWNIDILLGDKKNKYLPEKPPRHYDVEDLHLVATVKFPQEKADLGSFDYLITHAVKELLNDVKSIEKNLKRQEYGVFGSVDMDKKAIYYNDGKSQIDKTLYVEKELADKKNTEKKYAEALGISADKIKIVTKEEIATAIEKGDETINYTIKFNQAGPLIYSGKDSKAIARLK
jgi:hypothetical protein